MRKAVLLTLLCVTFFSASYAQANKNAAPTYDNVNKEREWNLRKMPPQQSKYALADKSEPTGNKPIMMPVSRINLLDSNLYKTNGELTRYDIKPYTFPKK